MNDASRPGRRLIALCHGPGEAVLTAVRTLAAREEAPEVLLVGRTSVPSQVSVAAHRVSAILPSDPAAEAARLGREKSACLFVAEGGDPRLETLLASVHEPVVIVSPGGETCSAPRLLVPVEDPDEPAPVLEFVVNEPHLRGRPVDVVQLVAVPRAFAPERAKVLRRAREELGPAMLRLTEAGVGHSLDVREAGAEAGMGALRRLDTGAVVVPPARRWRDLWGYTAGRIRRMAQAMGLPVWVAGRRHRAMAAAS